MLIVYLSIGFVIAVLVVVTLQKDLEAALPYFAFAATLLPTEVQIQLPGLFNLTAQRIGLIILMVLFLVKKPQSDPKAGKSTPLIFLIVIETIWMAVACANSKFQVVSWKTFLSQILDFYVLYFIFYRCTTSVATVKKILLGFLSAIMVCAVTGAFESYTTFRTLDLFPKLATRFELGDDMERGFRTSATFPHAILYGSALAIAIPMALYFLSET